MGKSPRLAYCPTCGQTVQERWMKLHKRPDRAWCSGPPRKPRAKKSWSVRDSDHIPIGSRVLIRADLGEHFSRWRGVAGALGIPHERFAPYGTVTKRWFGSGGYFIRMEGGPEAHRMCSTFDRSELVWPIPDGVIAFDPAGVRHRRGQRLSVGLR